MPAALLLALPLVVLSAMSPFLVALMRETVSGGDGGAGRVFFISTVGSVAGVLVTAFLFIPNLVNFRALLLIGCILCAGTAVPVLKDNTLSLRNRMRLLMGSVACIGLILGLVAGVVPRAFKRDGAALVVVVDINPDSLSAATTYFDFDPSGIELNWGDARTFARRCRNRFDVIVIDLFQGGTIPDHLLTAEFFQDLSKCVSPSGTIVMNAVLDRNNDLAHRRLLATVSDAFRHVRDFLLPVPEDSTAKTRNGYLVASNALLPTDPTAPMNHVPNFMFKGVTAALSSGRTITPEVLGDARPVTDNHNVFSILYANDPHG